MEKVIVIISFILIFVIAKLIEVIHSDEFLEYIPDNYLNKLQKLLALIIVLQVSIFYLSIIILKS